MNEVKINSTPVRTSQNYQINDIAITMKSDENVSSFTNCFLQDFDANHINISSITDELSLTYGNGKQLEKQVRECCNKKMQLTFQENSMQENMVHFIFDKENCTLIDDIEIIVPDNCEGKMTIRYATSLKEEGQYILYQEQNTNWKNIATRMEGPTCTESGYHNGVIRAKLGKNAKLKLTVVNTLGEEITNLIALENHLEGKANLEYTIVDFGGNSSVTNYYADLIGEESENNLDAIYLGTNHQLLDMNYIVAMHGAKTKVNMDVQGALKEEAKKHFKGTIDFKRGCKKAEGSENEFCMLLSDSAKSISLPMLLCDEEDVVGNHAAAAGKVSNKELFYIMSRGLTEKEAKILLIRAKFNKVIDKISNDDLKEEIIRELESKLE